MAKMPKPQNIGYFDLPGEVRNRIMGFALVPRLVRPRMLPTVPPEVTEEPSPSIPRFERELLWIILVWLFTVIFGFFWQELETFRTPRNPELITADTNFAKPKKSPNHGLQLLATSSQARAEGFSIFWELSTFQLPDGPATNTSLWLNTVDPKHVAMIKNVRIRLSRFDVTPRFMTYLKPNWASYEHDNDMALGLNAIVWADKIRILNYLPALENIYFDTGCAEFHVKGDFWRRQQYASIKPIVRTAMHHVTAEVHGLTPEPGWKPTWKWMMTPGNTLTPRMTYQCSTYRSQDLWYFQM